MGSCGIAVIVIRIVGELEIPVMKAAKVSRFESVSKIDLIPLLIIPIDSRGGEWVRLKFRPITFFIRRESSAEKNSTCT